MYRSFLNMIGSAQHEIMSRILSSTLTFDTDGFCTKVIQRSLGTAVAEILYLCYSVTKTLYTHMRARVRCLILPLHFAVEDWKFWNLPKWVWTVCCIYSQVPKILLLRSLCKMHIVTYMQNECAWGITIWICKFYVSVCSIVAKLILSSLLVDRRQYSIHIQI